MLVTSFSTLLGILSERITRSFSSVKKFLSTSSLSFSCRWVGDIFLTSQSYLALPRSSRRLGTRRCRYTENLAERHFPPSHNLSIYRLCTECPQNRCQENSSTLVLSHSLRMTRQIRYLPLDRRQIGIILYSPLPFFYIELTENEILSESVKN